MLTWTDTPISSDKFMTACDMGPYSDTPLTTLAVFLAASPGSIFFFQPKQITTRKNWNVEPTQCSPELIHFIFGDGKSPILLSHFEPWNKTLKHLFHTENYVHNNSCFLLSHEWTWPMVAPVEQVLGTSGDHHPASAWNRESSYST